VKNVYPLKKPRIFSKNFPVFLREKNSAILSKKIVQTDRGILIICAQISGKFLTGVYFFTGKKTNKKEKPKKKIYATI
jgi:hypothetical protein